MGIVKKILITKEGWETTIRVNDAANENEVAVYYQTNPSIIKIVRLVSSNIVNANGYAQATGNVIANEVVDPNGFSYADANPNYNQLECRSISISKQMLQTYIDKAIYQDDAYPEPVLDTVGAALMNEFYYRNDDWEATSEEDIVIMQAGQVTQIRQPFYLKIDVVQKSDPGTDDGSISIDTAESWGGPGPLEFSFNAGTYASVSSWPNLGSGTYSVRARDADGNESTIRDVVID